MQTKALRLCLELPHCKDSDCIEGLPVSQLSTVNFVIIAVNTVCHEINTCKWVNDKMATSV